MFHVCLGEALGTVSCACRSPLSAAGVLGFLESMARQTRILDMISGGSVRGRCVLGEVVEKTRKSVLGLFLSQSLAAAHTFILPSILPTSGDRWVGGGMCAEEEC